MLSVIEAVILSILEMLVSPRNCGQCKDRSCSVVRRGVVGSIDPWGVKAERSGGAGMANSNGDEGVFCGPLPVFSLQ